jgi:hypothetical protein
VRDEVLGLTYTAHDMAPFARDMGFIDPDAGNVKPPFVWDEVDRLHRRAKLDALYFMLYFPSATSAEIAALKQTAAYIYSTFPIVEREQLATHGRYLSRAEKSTWRRLHLQVVKVEQNRQLLKTSDRVPSLSCAPVTAARPLASASTHTVFALACPTARQIPPPLSCRPTPARTPRS